MNTRPPLPPRGVPNAGARSSRSRRRARSAQRHVLSGLVAWVDPSESLLVLRVERASLRARRFVGTTVTVDVGSARVSAPDRDGDGTCDAADLLPGERISMSVSLPVEGGLPPGVLAARTVTCASFA